MEKPVFRSNGQFCSHSEARNSAVWAFSSAVQAGSSDVSHRTGKQSDETALYRHKAALLSDKQNLLGREENLLWNKQNLPRGKENKIREEITRQKSAVRGQMFRKRNAISSFDILLIFRERPAFARLRRGKPRGAANCASPDT